jgi:hypothetical protein
MYTKTPRESTLTREQSWENPDLLLPYLGQIIAWTHPEGKFIAAAPTWEEIFALADETGLKGEEVLYEGMPDENGRFD